MRVVDLLLHAEYPTYLVGGCVRDQLLGRKPKDYDVATAAKPGQVVAVMNRHGLRVIPTGLKHGTVTVLDPDFGQVEVTTFRADGAYTDGRRPDSVEFGVSLEEDLARRDFTINAMAAHPHTGEIIDPFHGKNDLNNKHIRAVGVPYKRFVEDGLRPIRAARFAAQLGFRVERETLAAMEHMDVRAKVAVVAKERVKDEILKAMSGSRPSAFWNVLHQTRILDFVAPEMNELWGLPQPRKHHVWDVWRHSMETAESVKAQGGDPLAVLAGSWHDIGKARTLTLREKDGEPQFLDHENVGADIVDGLMRRLKFSTDERERVVRIVRHHMVFYESTWSKAALRRWVLRVGDDLVNDVMRQRKADLIAHGGSPSKRYWEILEMEERLQSLEGEGTKVIQKRNLALNGHDLLQMGFKTGPAVGDMLERLHELVLEHPEWNTREKLLEIVQQG